MGCSLGPFRVHCALALLSFQERQGGKKNTAMMNNVSFPQDSLSSKVKYSLYELKYIDRMHV